MAPLADLSVIDTDTHLTEPHDLWVSRAPRGYEDRVPHVVEVDGQASWAIEDQVLGRAMAAAVVDRAGNRCRGSEFLSWGIEDVHPGAYDLPARLAVMDEVGIYAQIVYPNVAGFGGQKFADVKDPELKLMCVRIYNDAMAEMQDASGGRFFPMALMPWWDIDASVAEAERAAQMGMRGVNMTSDPQASCPLPDLGDAVWDRLWEVCSDRALPVHFHIGASQTTMVWYGTSPWPSLGNDQKLGIGSAMMYITNARVLANLIYSGLLERQPGLKVVSVESGIGWIPFVLEALDHQADETAAGSMDYLSLRPSEYFKRQVYACYWFEKIDVAHTFELLGADNILFETDFPHPTCLYPDSLSWAAKGLEGVAPEVQRKVLQDNAAALYRIPLPA
jgi:predicted TIM-barrel fold metal-dependent hydrolase